MITLAYSYTIRMRKYELPPDVMIMLKGFCMGYNRKKARIQNTYNLSSPPFDAPVQGGLPSDPTMRKAFDILRDKADVQLIDDCLYEVSEGQKNIIIPLKKAVTENKGYRSVGIVYESADKFYLRRRQFYYTLYQKMKERGRI